MHRIPSQESLSESLSWVAEAVAYLVEYMLPDFAPPSEFELAEELPLLISSELEAVVPWRKSKLKFSPNCRMREPVNCCHSWLEVGDTVWRRGPRRVKSSGCPSVRISYVTGIF
jgi:hypothetical protein